MRSRNVGGLVVSVLSSPTVRGPVKRVLKRQLGTKDNHGNQRSKGRFWTTEKSQKVKDSTK